VRRRDGLTDGKIVSDGRQVIGWSNVSALKETRRIEDMSPMGLELAEHRGWKVSG
jgi:threonine synthase